MTEVVTRRLKMGILDEGGLGRTCWCKQAFKGSTRSIIRCLLTSFFGKPNCLESAICRPRRWELPERRW